MTSKAYLDRLRDAAKDLTARNDIPGALGLVSQETCNQSCLCNILYKRGIPEMRDALLRSPHLSPKSLDAVLQAAVAFDDVDSVKQAAGRLREPRGPRAATNIGHHFSKAVEWRAPRTVAFFVREGELSAEQLMAALEASLEHGNSEACDDAVATTLCAASLAHPESAALEEYIPRLEEVFRGAVHYGMKGLAAVLTESGQVKKP